MAELTFPQQLMKARELREQIKALTVEQKALDQNIMGTIFSKGDTSLGTEDGVWSVQNRTSKKINKAKLILSGVTAAQIEDATDESSSAPFLVWRERKSADFSGD